MKKIASILGGLALLSVSYGVASAATLEELQAQLQSIRAQIAALQAQDRNAASWVIDRAFSTSTVDGTIAPRSCKIWYDGCNTCTRTEPGGPLSCSTNQCVWNAGSSCREYFDGVGTNLSSGGIPPRICTLPYIRLGYGARGMNVTALQDFLRSEGVFSESSSGFFGPLTREALKKWQADQGIVNAGTAATTGWGVLGPQTWSVLQRRCILFKQEIFNATPQSGTAPLTVSFFVSVKNLSDYQEVALQNRFIRYIDFGDGSTPFEITCLNGMNDTCVATTTHTYSRAGDYIAQLFFGAPDIKSQVNPTNPKRKFDIASLVIKVNSNKREEVCTLEYAPVCGQPPEPDCRHSTPACMIPAPEPKTYGNLCQLKADGATYLYPGRCREEPVLPVMPGLLNATTTVQVR